MLTRWNARAERLGVATYARVSYFRPPRKRCPIPTWRAPGAWGSLAADKGRGLGAVRMSRDDVLTESVVRRIEVFTGACRRWRGSPEIKARIVAESYVGLVGEVADQYGLALHVASRARPPREARLEPAFAPVVLKEPVIPAGKTPSPQKMRRAGRGGIQLEIDGVGGAGGPRGGDEDGVGCDPWR